MLAAILIRVMKSRHFLLLTCMELTSTEYNGLSLRAVLTDKFQLTENFIKKGKDLNATCATNVVFINYRFPQLFTEIDRHVTVSTKLETFCISYSRPSGE